MAELKRSIIREILKKWHSGVIDEIEVHEKAEKLWEEQEDGAQYPDDNFRSIAVEVLSQLEILNHQLITRDDVPAMLAFLDTPPEKELEGWQEWRCYWEQLDLVARQESLSGNSYYSPVKEPMLPFQR